MVGSAGERNGCVKSPVVRGTGDVEGAAGVAA
jgi:hypothetical protein